MKKMLFISLLFAVIFNVTNAQKLTLLPQVGFENTNTSLNFNNLTSISPMNMNFTPQASLRLYYQSKRGFGPYVGISTTRPGVNFRFTDPGNAMNSFSAVTGSMQVALESGLQYSTKPITLGKAKTEKAAAPAMSKPLAKGGCVKSNLVNRCAGKTAEKTSQSKNQRTWLSIQPFLGFAYVPTAKTGLTSKVQGGQTNYEYRAGYHNAALAAGTSFEFGKNSQRVMTATVSYFNGIGNLNEESISVTSGGKTTVTNIKSDISGWNLKLGIPVTLFQKKPEKKQKSMREYKSECGQYRIIYKRCNYQ